MSVYGADEPRGYRDLGDVSEERGFLEANERVQRARQQVGVADEDVGRLGAGRNLLEKVLVVLRTRTRHGAMHGLLSPANANDRQKISAFIRRCIRTGFCSPDLADFHDLYISSDEKLFNIILTCPNHILRTLLPPPTAQNYSLRNRCIDFYIF